MFFLLIGPTITIPLAEYNELRALVSSLVKEVAELKAENQLLRNGKNSGTSHTPPSHQIGRPNAKSMRIKSGRKPGGQPGHEGSNLQIKAVPDEIIDYTASYCNGCSEDLAQVAPVLVESKQEVVIPPIQVRYVEHRSYSKVCSRCGSVCTGALPGHLKAPVQYGDNVGALVSYLSAYQFIPYRRISILLKDLFGLSVSEGSIDNMLERAAQNALPAYQLIRQKVQQSEVVGSDETGTSVAGKKGWFHTWQTLTLTFIVASLNRGFKTIEQYFADGFPAAVYVSDCWAAQLKVKALLHQLCTAHLLRELRNFEEALCCKWSIAMKQLLQDAITLKKQLTPQDYIQAPATVIELENRLTVLLNAGNLHSHKKVNAFFVRMKKNRNSILTFLYHPKVPPDNNGSERAIRPVKVKTKVSGQFRTLAGATRFAILRSVIDTTIKNTQNVFEGLTLLAKYKPE